MTTTTIDHKNFRVSACIDWLDVAATLTRHSQHRHITAALFDITGETLFADPLDEDKSAGGNATVFAIRFHDRLANDLSALTAVLDKLRAIYGFTAEPYIYRIEVACDHYWRGSQETRQAGLLAMTHQLQSSLYVSNTIKPRQWVPNAIGTVRPNRESGAYRFLDNAHERHRLDPNLSFRIGNEDDWLSWQIYFKTTDNNQTPIQDRTQWRARVEVTIQGDALQQFGLNNLSDLNGYNFRRLMPLFKFRRPIDPLKKANRNYFVKRITDPGKKARAISDTVRATYLNRQIHDATPARGMHSFDTIGRSNDLRGRTPSESRDIEADTVLADTVRGALRWLSLGESCQKNRRTYGD